MLNQILDHIHNYFIQDAYYGEFAIEDGNLSGVEFLRDGQYFRICGSAFNDGVHQYPVYGLIDEAFTGEIWAMAIPPALIALSKEISDWQAKYGETVTGPFQSESFGGYSYTKASGASGSGVADWSSMFRSQLNQWRKLKTGADVKRIKYERDLKGECYHHEPIE